MKAYLLFALLTILTIGIYITRQMRIPPPPNTVVIPKIIYDNGEWWVRVEENTWKPAK